MGRDEILHILRDNLEQLEREFGVSSIRLFGSVARGEATPDSDIDVLVDFRRTPTLFEFLRLRRVLGELLGTKVDLITESGLKERARAAVERDAIRVA
jgi:predicted nucleotidyltransferase